MTCPCQDTLLLKTNCKVMLVWNLSEKLKNGSMGIFQQMVDDMNDMDDKFEGEGTVLVGQRRG